LGQPAPAYEGAEPFVFVSYSHQDEARVYREIRWLQDQGVKIWYDTQIQAGSEWSDAVANAISGCARFLYFITPNSVVSENCRRELNHAIAESRSILAVHLQDTDVPGGIRLNLDNRQAILKHRLEPADYRSTLLRALSADIAGPEPRAAGTVSSSIRSLRLVSVIAVTLLIVIAVLWVSNRTPVGTATDAEPPLTAIAVLPFDDLSPSGDHAWLASGMAEDLIEALGRIEGLHVPARRSTTIVKASGADLASIGERLGVGTVVEGSVRRFGNELSVLARWIRIRDSRSLWSGKFDGQFGDVLEIQKKITIGIAEAIRTELRIQDAPASMLSERYATTDVRAWELLRKAAPLVDTLETTKLTEAEQMLQLAIEYDPKFVVAHEQIALIEYYGNVNKGVERFKEILKIDPSNRRVLSGFAWDSAMRFWDYETAERLLQRIPENEKTASTLDVEFSVFANTGRLDKAMTAAQRAVRLDPMWARAHCSIGYLHHAEGRWAAALASYERGLSVAEETGQGGAWCPWSRAEMLHRLGRESEVVQAFLRNEPSAARRRALRRGWETGGWEGINLALASAGASSGEGDYWSCNYPGLARARAENQLYECLEKEMSDTDVDDPISKFIQTARRQTLGQISWRGMFAPYREQPRFQDLLRRLNERMQRAAGTYERKVGLDLPN